MRTVGVYLIFAGVCLRAAVVQGLEPEFPAIFALLAGYGLVYSGKTWLERSRPAGFFQHPPARAAYLVLQSALVIAALIISTYEDFLAMLFLPLSLDAVSFFGWRGGIRAIGFFSLAMSMTLLFSDAGSLFGLGMGILYSGICFLFGGYAHQVQKARAAHDENERTFAELQKTYRRLQDYAGQLTSLAVEHERSRLARDLHDSVTQTVFSMNLAAQSAQLLLEKQPSRAASQLLRMEALAASALREIQTLFSQLQPLAFIEEGLPAALRRLAAEQEARDGLQVTLELQGYRALRERVTAGLYSIAHEALINVSKHSGTCEATVRLHLEEDSAWMEIRDHGRGFDPDMALDRRGHLGLAGMLERAREIGWQLSVWSQPGSGACIHVAEKPLGSPHAAE